MTPDPTLSAATVRLPGPPDLADERVIRPALSVLFRIAVGPSADYYAPRFIAFEQAGHGAAGWHWPALFAPAIWAFYRRLWVVGLVFALLPLAGAAATAAIAPWFDDATWLWLSCALLLTWALPGILGAAVANAALYRRIRRMVRVAEARSGSAAEAASRLGATMPTSPAAALLGVAALALALSLASPILTNAYNEHAVRVKIGRMLAGLSALTQQVDEAWSATKVFGTPEMLVLPARAGQVLFDEVVVNPGSGIIRLAMGSVIPELDGAAILMAPTVDRRERLNWVCVPVGVPERYLPRSCRQR